MGWLPEVRLGIAVMCRLGCDTVMGKYAIGSVNLNAIKKNLSKKKKEKE